MKEEKKDNQEPDRYCPECGTFLTFSVRKKELTPIMVLSCPAHGPVKEYAVDSMNCSDPECGPLYEIYMKEENFSVTITFSCPEHGEIERKEVDYGDFLYL